MFPIQYFSTHHKLIIRNLKHSQTQLICNWTLYFHRNSTLNQSAGSSPSGHVYSFSIFTELLLFSNLDETRIIARLWDSGFCIWPLFYDRSDIVTENINLWQENPSKQYSAWTQLHRKLNFHNISSTLRTWSPQLWLSISFRVRPDL